MLNMSVLQLVSTRGDDYQSNVYAWNFLGNIKLYLLHSPPFSYKTFWNYHYIEDLIMFLKNCVCSEIFVLFQSSDKIMCNMYEVQRDDYLVTKLSRTKWQMFYTPRYRNSSCWLFFSSNLSRSSLSCSGYEVYFFSVWIYVKKCGCTTVICTSREYIGSFCWQYARILPYGK